MQFRSLIAGFVVAATAVATVSATSAIDADLAIKVAGEARSLWHAHVATVGDYAVAVANDNKALAQAIQPHALEVSPNMTQWLSNWYGDKEESLSQFKTLFSDHIVTLAAIVDATKAKEEDKVAELKKKLTEGGKQLAAVIETLNPEAYPKDVVFALLSEHENLAVAAGAALIAQEWEAGYATHLAGFEQSKQVADALAKGVYAKLSNATAAAVAQQVNTPVSAALPFTANTRWVAAPSLVAIVAMML
ncbi:hypothetical protein DFJ77DRAFT_511371 [Powellomyces hirtus]|nr:hypothetical protein DFJ77DRAFT_511371 [Powellomyces hirtus]